jgi:hypothetical protein
LEGNALLILDHVDNSLSEYTHRVLGETLSEIEVQFILLLRIKSVVIEGRCTLNLIR